MSNIQNQIRQSELLTELENTIDAIQDVEEHIIDATKDFNKTVKLIGDQSIDGTKAFLNSPLVPDVVSTDNSTKVPNTKFVKSSINNAISSMLLDLENTGKAKMADFATSAGIADKANKDSVGNTITTTYATLAALEDYAKAIDLEGYAKINSNGYVGYADYATAAGKTSLDSNDLIIAHSYQRHVTELGATKPVLYVIGTGGNDNNDGLSTSKPLATLKTALRKAQQYNGVTNIYLLGGTIGFGGLNIVENFANIRLIPLRDTILVDTYHFINSHVEIKTNNHVLKFDRELVFNNSTFFIFNSSQYGEPSPSETITIPTLSSADSTICPSYVQGVVTITHLYIWGGWYGFYDNILVQLYDANNNDAHESFSTYQSYGNVRTGCKVVLGTAAFTSGGDLQVTPKAYVFMHVFSHLNVHTDSCLYCTALYVMSGSEFTPEGDVYTMRVWLRGDGYLYIPQNGHLTIKDSTVNSSITIAYGSTMYCNGGAIFFDNVQSNTMFVIEHNSYLLVNGDSEINFSPDGLQNKCTCTTIVEADGNSCFRAGSGVWIFNAKMEATNTQPTIPIKVTHNSYVLCRQCITESSQKFMSFTNPCSVDSSSSIHNS